jgi:hypothetical protein
MTGSLFRALGPGDIASFVRTAKRSVCYAAPTVHPEPAEAMAEAASRLGSELITVCLDFDERGLRMGFGDFKAVKALHDAAIAITSTFNAFGEAFNGRLRAECLNAHWFLSLADAAQKKEAWRRYYNEDRPHGAIGYKVPIALMKPGGDPGQPLS